MSSMYIWRLIFSCNLWTLYPCVHFLSMWLNGIIAIINSNGDNTTPWKIPFWIFVSALLFPLAISLTRQFFMIFSINFMTLADILYILRQSIIQFWFLNNVLFSDIILFKFSIFLSSSCVGVNSVWLGCVVFQLLWLCCSFQLDFSYFSVFGVLIIISGSCYHDSQFFFSVLKYFKVRKPTFLYYYPNLVSQPFTSCLKYRTFYPCLYYSFPMVFLSKVAKK